MKYPFMVEFQLPQPLTQEFIQLIPQNRLKTNKFLQEGIFRSYTLSADRTKLWIIVVGESEFEVMETLSELPLSEFMHPTVSPLAFHNTTTAWEIPAISLN